MVEISEDYLNITEPFEFDSSVSKIVYLSQDPRIGTDLNALTQTLTTITNNTFLTTHNHFHPFLHLLVCRTGWVEHLI